MRRDRVAESWHVEARTGSITGFAVVTESGDRIEIGMVHERADADLIAAAPALAEALGRCMSAMEAWGAEEDGLPVDIGAADAHESARAALEAAGLGEE